MTHRFALGLSLVLAATLAAPTTASLRAQAPSVTSYGTPCPLSNNQPWTPLANSTRGLPRIGTTFEVTGISPRVACGLLACVCNCCLCNPCTGPDLLLIGTARSNIPVPLPGLFGDGCPILAFPDVVVTGDLNGTVAIAIPNQQALLGQQFNLQEMTILSATTNGSQGCTQETYVLRGVRVSDGVECLIGM